jgi:hypothetical protein
MNVTLAAIIVTVCCYSTFQMLFHSFGQDHPLQSCVFLGIIAGYLTLGFSLASATRGLFIGATVLCALWLIAEVAKHLYMMRAMQLGPIEIIRVELWTLREAHAGFFQYLEFYFRNYGGLIGPLVVFAGVRTQQAHQIVDYTQLNWRNWWQGILALFGGSIGWGLYLLAASNVFPGAYYDPLRFRLGVVAVTLIGVSLGLALQGRRQSSRMGRICSWVVIVAVALLAALCLLSPAT